MQRPLVFAAACLCLGQWAGAGLASVRADGGSAGAAFALGLVLCAVAVLWARMQLGRGRGGAPILALALLCAAAVRAAYERDRWPRRLESREAAEAVLAAPLEGRYRALGGIREAWGWLEPLDGSPPPPWRLAFSGTSPENGALVRLLSPLDPRPFARGPKPGPAAREGHFHGELPIASDQWVLLAMPTGGPGLADWAQALNERLSARLVHATPSAPGLGPALALGDRAHLDPELVGLFRRTGVSHLLALSGMHVAVLAALALVPLGRLAARLVPRRQRPRAEWVVRAAMLLAFAVLVGFAPPVARASTALCLFWLLPHLGARGVGWAEPRDPGRRPDGLSLWAAALCFELIRSPLGAMDIATQLSYAATLGLILTTRPLADQIAPREDHRSLERVLRSALHPARALVQILVLRARRAVALSAAVSVAATLATAPLTLLHFGEFSPWSAPASALAAPLLAPLLLGLWLELALPDAPFAALADGFAAWLVQLLTAVDRLPATPYWAPERPFGFTAAIASALLAAAYASGRATPHVARRLAALGCVGLGTWLLPWTLAPDRLEVHALDVGHGTAALVRAPGIPLVLFDLGSRDRPGLQREALGPLLASWETRRLWVVLSHRDKDHWLGLPWLLARVPPERWIGPDPVALGFALPPGLLREDLGQGAMDLVAKGMGPTEVRVVRGLEREDNEGSRHLWVESGGKRALLFGDAVGPGLSALVERDLLPPSADLLLLPHHGSFGREAVRLLERVPAIRHWVSVDRPPPLAEELSRRGEPWAWTGRDGPLRWSPR